MRARRGYTWKRFRLSLAASAFLALMGFGVRLAEERQVGYTNDASMWVFVAAGLFAYYAAIVAFVLLRAARAGRSASGAEKGGRAC